MRRRQFCFIVLTIFCLQTFSSYELKVLAQADSTTVNVGDPSASTIVIEDPVGGVTRTRRYITSKGRQAESAPSSSTTTTTSTSRQ